MIFRPFGLYDDDPDDPDERFGFAKALNGLDATLLATQVDQITEGGGYSTGGHATIFGKRCAFEISSTVSGHNFGAPLVTAEEGGVPETCQEVIARTRRLIAEVLVGIEVGSLVPARSLTVWRPWRLTREMMELVVRAIDTVQVGGFVACIGEQLTDLPMYATAGSYLVSRGLVELRQKDFARTQQLASVHVYVKVEHLCRVKDTSDHSVVVREVTAPPFVPGGWDLKDVVGYESPDVALKRFLDEYNDSITVQSAFVKAKEEEKPKPVPKSMRSLSAEPKSCYKVKASAAEIEGAALSRLLGNPVVATKVALHPKPKLYPRGGLQPSFVPPATMPPAGE